MLAEFDRFITCFQRANNEADVMIVYSGLHSGFSAGGDLREMYAHLQNASPSDLNASIRESLRRSHHIQIKKFDPSARIAAKRFIKQGFEDELENEIEIFSQLFVQPAVREGLRKFVESQSVLPYLP